MIVVGIDLFKQQPEYYLDWAARGEPIEVLTRDGKTIRLEVKEKDDD